MSDQIPRTLALAWGVAAAPQRGPKRELTLERIIEAAVSIADEEGIGAVTMQRVAKQFGFSTMALYRYVSTKDELYLLMLDTALTGDETAVGPESWKSGLETFTRALVAMYREHPWVLDIPLDPNTRLMPGQIRAVDTGLRAMRTLGISFSEKLAVLTLISSFVRGYMSTVRENAGTTQNGEQVKQLLREAVTPGQFPDLAPLIQNGLYFGAPDDQSIGQSDEVDGLDDESEALLELTLGVVFAGIEQVLTPAVGEQ